MHLWSLATKIYALLTGTHILPSGTHPIGHGTYHECEPMGMAWVDITLSGGVPMGLQGRIPMGTVICVMSTYPWVWSGDIQPYLWGPYGFVLHNVHGCLCIPFRCGAHGDRYMCYEYIPMGMVGRYTTLPMGSLWVRPAQCPWVFMYTI
jgi:hypothetical protein